MLSLARNDSADASFRIDAAAEVNWVLIELRTIARAQLNAETRMTNRRDDIPPVRFDIGEFACRITVTSELFRAQRFNTPGVTKFGGQMRDLYATSASRLRRPRPSRPPSPWRKTKREETRIAISASELAAARAAREYMQLRALNFIPRVIATNCSAEENKRRHAWYTYQNGVPNVLLNVFDLLPLLPANTHKKEHVLHERRRKHGANSLSAAHN